MLSLYQITIHSLFSLNLCDFVFVIYHNVIAMQTIITFLDELIVITLLLSVLALAIMMIAIFYAFISKSIKEEILPMIKRRTPMDLGTRIFFKYPVDGAKHHLPYEHSLSGLYHTILSKLFNA